MPLLVGTAADGRPRKCVQPVKPLASNADRSNRTSQGYVTRFRVGRRFPTSATVHGIGTVIARPGPPEGPRNPRHQRQGWRRAPSGSWSAGSTRSARRRSTLAVCGHHGHDRATRARNRAPMTVEWVVRWPRRPPLSWPAQTPLSFGHPGLHIGAMAVGEGKATANALSAPFAGSTKTLPR